MEQLKEDARELIRLFKGGRYAFGPGAIEKAGSLAAELGQRFLLVRGRSCSRNNMLERLRGSLSRQGLAIESECPGAAPNSPVQDVERVRDVILDASPEAVIGLGGGSLIDGLKGSITLATLGGSCEDYYGVGKVSERLEETGLKLIPFLAVQTASGSGAHLTKYANLTDLTTMQKKLFIDDAEAPPRALFDYDATRTMPAEFTKVGAFDGICHLLEVYFGLPPDHPKSELVGRIALVGLELIIAALPEALERPQSGPARESIALGTDLGGYAIMIGATNGPHLNSFSLVDVMDHGKAAALLTPYYTCFFAPAIPRRLLRAGRVYQRYGHIPPAVKLDALSAFDLGLAVGRGMAALARSVGFPTRLDDVDGFGDEHVERMLRAAGDPALASKLKGMPIPLRPEDVDRYMRPILEAARSGDFSLIESHD
ncbi:MAG: iron-containing alcohol dehydrogenase [Planctomycetes bacterium]|nr:iron-containing alcohol dehydrogenase [Planctomycetota bacterium]